MLEKKPISKKMNKYNLLITSTTYNFIILNLEDITILTSYDIHAKQLLFKFKNYVSLDKYTTTPRPWRSSYSALTSCFAGRFQTMFRQVAMKRRHTGDTSSYMTSEGQLSFSCVYRRKVVRFSNF